MHEDVQIQEKKKKTAKGESKLEKLGSNAVFEQILQLLVVVEMGCCD